MTVTECPDPTVTVSLQPIKYVFTGVIIASLFKEMTDKLSLYLLGMLIVFAALWVGLRISSKTKE